MYHSHLDKHARSGQLLKAALWPLALFCLPSLLLLTCACLLALRSLSTFLWAAFDPVLSPACIWKFIYGYKRET